ncbi:hypothetical protein H7H78_16695 [Mycobacterium shinjukuense]|uniref:hypothetical protein n=1 Tax=Mycobacterium shinjukuense TaxID=398694 RepID=UPI0009F2CE00|nr:hypothetical protein [Mycobacterium shinjukuense]MCV6986992.1 hypothetical protein [Mycobacterium shinjukuense]ORB71195.1 hypothetical protein BST45_03790 [Mycobacterium shinjukuense]
MVGSEKAELPDQRTSRRPCFSRAAAPIGVYNGQQAIIVYDLRPVPLWPKYWIQALAHHFHRRLSPSPKIDISLVDDCIRFSIFVSTDVSAEDLCKLDDAVYDSVRNAGRAIATEQTALDHKLDEVRQRRMENWDESYFCW